MTVSRSTPCTRLFPEGLQDGLGDRRRDRAARAALDALEHHGDREAIGEADEPRVVEALEVDLRGARLAGHVDALERGRGARALLDDVAHHVADLLRGLLGHDALGLL